MSKHGLYISLLHFYFLTHILGDLTYQWLYCTEIFNLVATKVEMCEVGAFLRQNFQPSWDPVIAEFELLKESTISVFENGKIKIIVTLEKEKKTHLFEFI